LSGYGVTTSGAYQLRRRREFSLLRAFRRCAWRRRRRDNQRLPDLRAAKPARTRRACVTKRAPEPAAMRPWRRSLSRHGGRARSSVLTPLQRT